MSVTVEALLRRIVQNAINILLMLKKVLPAGNGDGLLPRLGSRFSLASGEVD